MRRLWVLLALSIIVSEAYPQATSGLPAPNTPPSNPWNRRGTAVNPDWTMTNPYTAAEATVIVEGSPKVYSSYYTVIWKMWYSCGQNICYAESPDGITNWVRYTGGGGTQGSLLSGYTQSNVIKNGSTYYLFANNNSTGIDLYTSTDGVTFTLVHANVITGVNNSGGIFQSGTLYLFAELSGGGTHLYTATSPFTSFTDQGSIAATLGVIRGPSAPYLLNGRWYLWVHSDATVGLSLPAVPQGTASVILRLTANSLTGPWTNSETSADFIPRTDDEFGGTANEAQVADPYVLEVAGKTYLYYTASFADATRVYQHIKVAVANQPMASVVQTVGGENTGAIDSSVRRLDVAPDSPNFALDFRNQALENVGNPAATNMISGTGSIVANNGNLTVGCIAANGCANGTTTWTLGAAIGSTQYSGTIVNDANTNSGFVFIAPRNIATSGFYFRDHSNVSNRLYIESNSGKVTTTNQTLDDGSGNLTVLTNAFVTGGNATLGCDASSGCPIGGSLLFKAYASGNVADSYIQSLWSGNGMTFTVPRNLATKGFYFEDNTSTNVLFFIDSVNGKVTSLHQTLDDGSGNMSITGSFKVASARKGTFTCTGGGTISISNSNETATSDVIISLNAQAGTITTPPAMKTVTGGSGFSVLCGATDTSTYNYDILN